MTIAIFALLGGIAGGTLLVEFGGAALVAARSFPWRTAASWAALVFGVLVVGTMAVRLAREMRSQPP